MIAAEPPTLLAVAERLNQAVTAAGGRRAVSEAADVPLSSLDRYLAAKSEAPSLTLARLARACGTSVDALLTGAEAAPALRPARANGRGEHGGDDLVRVPFLGVRASAGQGRASLPAETAADAHFLFSRAWLRSLGVAPDRAELLRAQGDSMDPTLQDGDLMLVDRGFGEPVHGKIYALVVDGLVLVKRVNFLAGGGMILISDNDRYPSETIRRDAVADLSFQGRVAWYGRAI
ncbi:helix-turn-helix transcriptional regulator [Methylobacterium sp. J-070]|uniref:S24 family peptidase n=1 Tax=Methylobacterium sp. J-070 TaxID=2836650 RepID=UPI001FB8AECD|nr:S24 family peptidase [Methylobacterium sp. J-070]MCJ2050865.1 S24 family peptidase [Methylobacterium sp. J-070]